MARRPKGSGKRSRSARTRVQEQYPRTARLNSLIREIAADFFERIDDEHLPLLTITGVKVDADLNRAQIFLSTLDSVDSSEADESLVGLLQETYAKPLRSKIGSETRLRKTPEVLFLIDPAVREGARIEEILATLDISDTAVSDITHGGEDANG